MQLMAVWRPPERRGGEISCLHFPPDKVYKSRSVLFAPVWRERRGAAPIPLLLLLRSAPLPLMYLFFSPLEFSSHSLLRLDRTDE